MNTRSLITLAVVATVAVVEAAAQQSPSAAAGADIIVKLTGIANDKGMLTVSLYTSKQSWLAKGQALQAIRIKPTPPAASVTFENIPPGTYAVGVHHDEDLDGKLGFAWFPFPHVEEGVGMSNNPSSKFGPPSFQQAKFEHGSAALTLDIKLTR